MRTKTVYPTGEIAHRWAHQLDSERIRNPHGNFYYEGKTIYSYGSHFPIATLLDDGVVMMTNRTYSNTTAKHIGEVRYAITHMTKIYCNRPDLRYHCENLDAFAMDIKSHLSLITKRTRSPKYMDDAQASAREAKKYMEYFELKPTAKLKEALKLITSEDALSKLIGHNEKQALKRREQGRKWKQDQAAKQEAERQRAMNEIPLWKAYTPSEQRNMSD